MKRFIVCEFGGFQNVLRDACVRHLPTTDSLIQVFAWNKYKTVL